jgi:hypothetical protein
MGLFKKLGDSLGGAMQPQSPEEVMAQQRAMGIDTAAFGGPSNAAVADDDPIWNDVEGISLQDYAKVAKAAQNAGVTDEVGMAAVAEQQGFDGETFNRAAKVWIERMGQQMAVGQRFRQYLDAS